MQQEQQLMVVDRDDHLVEYAPRSVCHTGDGRMHRAILVLLYNSDGKMLLQRRKHALFDDQWDLSGATHPLHVAGRDESYEEAAARLLRVEWGVTTPMRQVLPFTYFARSGTSCENEYCMLLAAQFDGVFVANPDHAYATRWATLTEARSELLGGKPPYTPWARVALESLGSNPRGWELAATLA